jgi:hypothetical protein
VEKWLDVTSLGEASFQGKMSDVSTMTKGLVEHLVNVGPDVVEAVKDVEKKLTPAIHIARQFAPLFRLAGLQCVHARVHQGCRVAAR